MYQNLFSIKGKTVLITGGSRGIGLMIARGYVSALHLNFLLKKQENHAAIFMSCSIDAAKAALRAVVNFAPLSLNWYLFWFGSFRIIP